jgi:hypothetical protein
MSENEITGMGMAAANILDDLYSVRIQFCEKHDVTPGACAFIALLPLWAEQSVRLIHSDGRWPTNTGIAYGKCVKGWWVICVTPSGTVEKWKVAE